jgi:hypothetical protein
MAQHPTRLDSGRTVPPPSLGRRNELKSTGPKTDSGKQRISGNAVCHGLSAETVILSLEDADDDRAFELAVTSNYDAETALSSASWSFVLRAYSGGSDG